MCSGSQLDYPEFQNLHVYNSVEDSKIDKNLSVCITSINPESTSEDYIKQVFHKLNLGNVTSVDFHPLRDSNGDIWDRMAFVHIKWYDGVAIEHLQDKILNDPRGGRIVHDDPRFWVLVHNKRPISKIYTDLIDNLYDSMNEMTTKINSLEQKNEALETKLQELDEWNLNYANVKIYTDKSIRHVNPYWDRRLRTRTR